MAGHQPRPVAVVLDNEAAQALAHPAHPKHRRLLAFVEASAGRNRRSAGSAVLVVPTGVRVEAALSRQDPGSAELGRLRVRDVELSSARADRAVDLLRVAGGSPADAAVAQCAEELAEEGRRVTVLTSDRSDLLPLVAAAGRSPAGVRIQPV